MLSVESGGEGRRALFSWCLFDWANSAFPTVITTFVFATYFTTTVAESTIAGTAAWGHAQSLAALIIALLGPALGAIADRGGRRKPWLLAFTALCVAACVGLWFTQPERGDVIWALTFVVLGTVGFEIGMVFYNALLPEIAAPERLGRLSGWGWGMGYAGGLACLSVALVGFIQTDAPWFGLAAGTAEPVHATTLLVAAWVSLFALPLFLWTPDKPRGERTLEALRNGLVTLVNTLCNIRRYAQTARFLLARMIYIDGLNTLFAFGGIYAAGTFGMALEEVILFGIAINVTAGIGAACFAWLDDNIGPKRTILIALGGLIWFGGALLLASGKVWFWALALPLGLFVGPAQAASRSFMARLAPPHMRAEMFGLFAFSGKVTAFLGPLFLAWATLAFDSQRAGMATIIVFLAVGFVLLLPLRDPGRE
jgi:UMF1 family MFS transporter